MAIEYMGLNNIQGPLAVIEGVDDTFYEEMVTVTLDNGEKRIGRVIEISGDKAVIQVFEGTSNLSLTNTKTKFMGEPMRLPLSKEMLGRTLDGSSIDCLATLIRGQKLPIFSGDGLPHDDLAVQIARQAKVVDPDDENGEKFAIVFAAMGVKHDVANYFKKSFEESGVLGKVVMFLNLSNDPVVERIITPRCALTAAEYLAFKHDMHVLVILTDMTSYAEALREVSSSKGEIPSRKGFPGYLYSDLASLYERAGIIKDAKGSVTQVPILTMPNDDITHPIPDLTGYITEGQIVLGRELSLKGVYPPVSILPSLSRLMKDGIGEGFTRADHPELSNQLFAAYSKVEDAKSLASVIGEDELSDMDKKYIKFGRAFEEKFLTQGKNENRTIDDTLNLGWELLGMLPKSELDRVSDKTLEKYYRPVEDEEV